MNPLPTRENDDHSNAAVLDHGNAAAEDSKSDSMINLRRKLDQADLERLSLLHPYHPTHFRVAGHAFVDRALDVLAAKAHQHEQHRHDTQHQSRPSSPRSEKNRKLRSAHLPASANPRLRSPSAAEGRQEREQLGRVECSQASLWALRPMSNDRMIAAETTGPPLTRDQVSDIIARHSTRTWAVGRSASPSPTRQHGRRNRSKSPTNRKRHSSPERGYGSNPAISSVRVPLPYRLYMMHFGNDVTDDEDNSRTQDESANTKSTSIDVERLIQVVAKSFPRDPLDPVYPLRQHISFGTDGLTPRPDTRSGRYQLLKKGLRPASASATPPRHEQVVAAQTAKRDKFIRAVSACAGKNRAPSTKLSGPEPICSPSAPSSVTSSRIGSASLSNRSITAPRRPSTAAPGHRPNNGSGTEIVSTKTHSRKSQQTVAQLRDRVKRVLSAHPHLVPILPVPETVSNWTPPWRNRPQTPPPSGIGNTSFKSAAAADEVILRIPDPVTSVASGTGQYGAKAVKAVGIRKRAGSRSGGKVGEPVDVFKGLVLPSIGLGVESGNQEAIRKSAHA